MTTINHSAFLARTDLDRINTTIQAHKLDEGDPAAGVLPLYQIVVTVTDE